MEFQKANETQVTRALGHCVVDATEEISTQRMREIEIIEAAEAYYLSEPIMSDEQFEELVEELRDIAPDSPILKRVGWGITVYGDKVLLPEPIRHSLDKVTGLETLTEIDYQTSLKIDGMTAVLQYEGGTLKLMASRGDGIHGVDHTPKAYHIKTIPIILKEPMNIILRGELYISLPDFAEHYADEYSNPRAAVAGFMNRKAFTNLEHVEFVVHPETKHDHMKLFHHGFRVLAEQKLKPSEFEAAYKQNKYYPTDGIVCSEYDHRDIFAFKFKTEKVKTKVTRVEYNIKKGGKLVPIIHYNPVKLYGTICKKCTGFNYQYIKDNGIGPGTEIELTKANEIIPYITQVISGNETPDLPACDYRIEGVHAYVTEDIQYELSLKHFIKHHFCFDGFKRPEIIVEALMIQELKDLYELNNPIMHSRIVESLSNHGVKSLGHKIAEKMTAKSLNEKDFFSQFGFDGLGTKASEALQPFVAVYCDMLSEFSSSCDNHMGIDRIASEAGVNITVRNILLDVEFRKLVSEARTTFKWHYKDTTPKVADGDVKATFIITGGLPSGKTKKQFADFVVPYGYKMVTTANQADIVIGSSTSNTAKAKHAKEKGKPLLTEEQFMKKYLEDI